MPEAFFYIQFFIFGAIFGSFANVLILRLPAGESLLPASHCMSCQAPVRWFDNIPIISWFWLKGRCRACGQPFSFQYPLVELLTALLFAVTYARWGITFYTFEILLFVFMGVSAPGVVTVDMVKSMAKDPIVFAMANPVPEIQPELLDGIVAVMATGRSDYANQINNVLAFPGLLRGAIDCRAEAITTGMFLEAAPAIATLIPDSELRPDHIVPSVFDPRVAAAVSAAVQQAARDAGIARN